jgi:hypothetical protein
MLATVAFTGVGVVRAPAESIVRYVNWMVSPTSIPAADISGISTLVAPAAAFTADAVDVNTVAA